MNIFFTVKNSSSKRPHLHKKSLNIEVDHVLTLQSLLCLIVKNQVDEFNEAVENKNLFTFFQQQMNDQSGRISFGSIYNDNKLLIPI